MSEVVPPAATEVGEADNVTTGKLDGGVVAATVIATLFWTWPALPLQVRYRVPELYRTTLRVPLTPSVPPQAPEATHDVVLVDDQLTLVAAPRAIVVGVADSVSVGVPAAGALMDAPRLSATAKQAPEYAVRVDTIVAPSLERGAVCAAATAC